MNYLSCAFVFQSRGRPLSCFCDSVSVPGNPHLVVEPQIKSLPPFTCRRVQESSVKHNSVYPDPSSKEDPAEVLGSHRTKNQGMDRLFVISDAA